MVIKVDQLKRYPIKGMALGGGFALVLHTLDGGQEPFGPFETADDALRYHDDNLTTPYNVEVEVEGKKKVVRCYFKQDCELAHCAPLSPQELDPEKPSPGGFGIWPISPQVHEWVIV